MHTPIEFYVVLPQDLFRLGRASRAKLDSIRTTPPRAEHEPWDLRLERNGVIAAESGGLSLFSYRNPGMGSLWWKLPKGTRLPAGLLISLDKGGSPGKRHFTVRPVHDMPLALYLEKLRELETRCIPAFLGSTNERAG